MMTDQYPFDNPLVPGSIWNKNQDYNVPVLSQVGAGPKGDKGDPLTFQDLTDDQVNQIGAGVAAAVNDVQDALIVTSGTSTTSVTIPFDIEDYDILFIDVNGLDLAENDDYTVSGNTVSLVTPLPAGQEVHIRALRYQLPDGSKNIVNYENNRDYFNVAAMQADETIEAGDICHTLGFHTSGDGGAAWYKIVSHAVANGMDIIALDNGCFAILQITTPYIYSKTYGSTTSGDTAELYAIQFAADNSLYFWDLENE